MNQRSNCRCSLCRVEEQLRGELADPCNRESLLEILRSAPRLAFFSTAEDLLCHLQSLNGHSSSDPFLRELLVAKMRCPESIVGSFFIILFLPVLHATVRRVRHCYPSLVREDVAQQALSALLDYLTSAHLAARETYLAFAIARRIRRATFEWADRETRSPVDSCRADDLRDGISSESAGDSFERAALLRHFFGRAIERGTLTPSELALLLQFKLEGGAENGAFTNAERQRLKRLLAKLRRFARPKTYILVKT
jgi:hypothetical protein